MTVTYRKRQRSERGIRIFIICFFFLFFFVPCITSAMDGDSLSVRYRRGINTDVWQDSLLYRKTFFSKYFLTLMQTASTSRLRLGSGEDKWKDQVHWSVHLVRPVSPRWLWTFLGDDFLYTDKVSGYQNDIRTRQISSGFTFNHDRFSVPFQVGVKQDRRYYRTDTGGKFSLGIQVPKTSLGGYLTRFQAAMDRDKLDKRQNSDLSVACRISRQFYEGTGDTLELSLNQRRRDYYVSAAGIIESRDESGQRAHNELSYRISPHLRLHLLGELGTRQLRISLLNGDQKGLKRQRRDFISRGEMHAFFFRSGFQSHVSLSYEGQDQRYRFGDADVSSPFSGRLSRLPDNKSGYTTLILDNLWQASPHDTLSLFARLERYRYDTSEESNFDDRDELRYWINLESRHKLSPQLGIKLRVGVNLLHTVYIFGERSADNNWTRVLRFSPQVRWTPTERLSISQNAEVMANYVDYDYDSLFVRPRSYLYRKFRLHETGRVALTRRLDWRINYTLELDENGKLIWDRWLEQRVMNRTNHTWVCGLNYRIMRGLVLGTGYSFFQRKGYVYKPLGERDTVKNLSMNFRSRGPTMRLEYQSRRLTFLFYGNFIETRSLNASRQTITRIEMNLRWKFS